MNTEDVKKALEGVMDPELKKDLITLNMARNIEIHGEDVSFDLVLTTPACPMKSVMKKDAEKALTAIGAKNVTVNFKSEVKSKKGGISGDDFIKQSAFEKIKNIIPVYSGKGGVGKSSVSANLAVSLAKSGASVGLLDLDVYGPSIPRMFGISGGVKSQRGMMIPLQAHGVKLMSVGFLLKDPTAPVAWRGPLVSGAIKQLFEETDWGELDYLVVDLPPGTGDVQLTFAQSVPTSGVVFVTTPQKVAVDDTLKAYNLFSQMNLRVLGIVNNMAYLKCPKCGEKTEVFPTAGVLDFAKEYQLEILGEIPLDPALALSGDEGTPLSADSNHEIADAFLKLSEHVAAAVSRLSIDWKS